MKTKSIELLNLSIADELAAVHQYMYFHFRCNDYGYDLLSNLFKRTAIVEMLHVEQLAERILFLKGEVEMKTSAPCATLSDPKDMLAMACQMESGSVDDYNKFANLCAANSDSQTKKMFEALVADEEMHLDQFETEMDNLEKFGNQYLALQSIERSKTVSMPSTTA